MPLTANSNLREWSDHLIEVVERGYRRSNWNGVTMRSTLREVDAALATWRPPEVKRSILDNVLHCAYWKNRVRHRISRDRGRSFPIPGRDWFEMSDDLDQEAWEEMIRISDCEHEKLCASIHDALAASDLDQRLKSSRQIIGVATHDVYHTGQIKLICAQYKRLAVVH